MIASKIQRAFSAFRFQPRTAATRTRRWRGITFVAGRRAHTFHKNITLQRGFLFFLLLSFFLSPALFAPSFRLSFFLSLSLPPLSLSHSLSLFLSLHGCMLTSLKTDHPPFRRLKSSVSRRATMINKFFVGKRSDQKEFSTLLAGS